MSRDRLVPVRLRVPRRRLERLLPDAGVGLAHHLLAVIDADQVLLEDVVIEHELGGLAEVDHPLAQVRRRHAVRHVLRVAGAGGVVVSADSADAARDEVRVAGILSLHEDAVSAEDRRCAVALGDDALLEVDLRVDPEAPDDTGDRIPVHLHQIGIRRLPIGAPLDADCHVPPSGIHQIRWYPVSSFSPRFRHFVSLSTVFCVNCRSDRMTPP